MRDFARAQARSREFFVLIAFVFISVFIATGCTTGGVGPMSIVVNSHSADGATADPATYPAKS